MPDFSKEYERLKQERNRLKQQLDQNKNIKGHATYKAVEQLYQSKVTEIKQLFKR